MSAPDIDLLLQIIDQAYDRKSWHGPNLRGSIRGVEAATAVWRPGAERFACQSRRPLSSPSRPKISDFTEPGVRNWLWMTGPSRRFRIPQANPR